MLDFFAIFSKGGIVLWCCQNSHESYKLPVNDLIQNVLIPEKAFGDLSRQYKQLMLKYKLDNEFELVFVVAYQSSIQLSYVDKFLSDVQLYFRDKFKNELQSRNYSATFEFNDDFKALQKQAEKEAKENDSKKKMKTFDESAKSKKTVATGLIVQPKKEEKNAKPMTEQPVNLSIPPEKSAGGSPSPVSFGSDTGGSDSDTAASILANREKLRQKMMGGKKPAKKEEKESVPKRKGKSERFWGPEMGGKTKNLEQFDYSKKSSPEDENREIAISDADRELVGTMRGGLEDISSKLGQNNEDSGDEEFDFTAEEENGSPIESNSSKHINVVKPNAKKGGMWGLFNSLVGAVSGAPLTMEQMQPTLDRLRDHLISKNVAAEVAERLCQSIAARLEGKVLSSFQTINAAVKSALQDSCMQILQPSRRIDLLGGALEAQRRSEEGMTVRPYIVTFCGVNGVGKSTNLAKICFWLMENKLRVLIAACDTFRSGAVEQLRTHVRRLSALHPPIGKKNCVEVFERGYGKDATGVAMEAINYARSSGFDVVLVDTAGRMQDNTPLMASLSKLIHVNQPDLVLFVGEALVGNDGVDQLVKFQQALLDNAMGPTVTMSAAGQVPVDTPAPRCIDGIVLTKFDTIDDQVGAAISMTYTTGKPIVFVGTGQTYADLATLNADSVVRALMK